MFFYQQISIYILGLFLEIKTPKEKNSLWHHFVCEALIDTTSCDVYSRRCSGRIVILIGRLVTDVYCFIKLSAFSCVHHMHNQITSCENLNKCILLFPARESLWPKLFIRHCETWPKLKDILFWHFTCRTNPDV